MTQTLALLGGKPVRDKPFPWDAKLCNISSLEKELVEQVLESRNLSPFYKNPDGGRFVHQFEDTFARLFTLNQKGSRQFFAVSCNSGTAALHMAYAALGIGCTDEVIVPAYTFIATATAAMHHNAIPIFADCALDTFNVEPEHVEPLITPHTKAIALVHILGNPCNMLVWREWLIDYNERHHRDIVIVEDCAQAIGARDSGSYVGTFGSIGTFSFQHTKTITTGEGGMIVTDNYPLAERCKLIRNHGETRMSPDMPRQYISHILGWNYRMCEIEAAIGFAQLLQLNEFNSTQIENAKVLEDHFTHLWGADWVPQAHYPRCESVYSLFGTRLISMEPPVNRETLIAALQAEGVTATTGYPRPIYRNPIFQQATAYGMGCPFLCWNKPEASEQPCDRRDVVYHDYAANLCLPNSETLCNRSAIWFDLHRYPATPADMDDIGIALQKIQDNLPELYKYQELQEYQAHRKGVRQ